MTKHIERLSSDEHRLQPPIERFDDIAQNLMPLMREDAFMGASTTPNLPIGEIDMRFTVFKPRAAEQAHYGPSILCQRLVLKEQGVISFLAPESEIFLRRNKLEMGEDTEMLDELLPAINEYGLVAKRLTPSEARELGFSKEFVNSRSKSSRTSRFLAKIL